MSGNGTDALRGIPEGGKMKRLVGLFALLGALQGTPLLAQDTAASETDPPVVNDKPPEKQCQPDIGCVTNLPLPRYVSLKGSEGNARRGPGLTHRIDWVFTRAGMPLKITAEFENWRRVEDFEGAGGWVHYSLLSGVRSALVTLDMAELHDAPEDGSTVVAQAELGVIGRILECSPTWCRVSLEGTRGWIRKTAIWGVRDDELVE
ncbi:MAG: SH3 domain-containing protein [Pseudomonadota bacterium]